MRRNQDRHTRRAIPELNTSSLPDLIFTVLFFFMIVANMRHDVVKVQFRQPSGHKLERLENKSLTTTIYIGRATSRYRSAAGSDVIVQINDRIVPMEKVEELMKAERMRLSDDEREQMVVRLKIDKDVSMSIVNRVKHALSQARVLKVCYAGENKKSTR